MNLANIAYWTYDVNTRTFTVDEGVWAIIGTDSQNEEGYQLSVDKLLNEYVHPDDRHMFEGYLNIIQNDPGGWSSQNYFRIMRCDGQVRYVVVFSDPNGYADCKTASLFGAIQDITERKQVETALLESELQYHNLFQSTFEAIAIHKIILDPDGTPYDYQFLEINPAFEKMTGLERSKIIGSTVRQVIPTIDPTWIERYGKVALTGVPDHFEEYSPELGKYYQVFAYQNAPMQFTTNFTDVTERKRLEEALVQTNVKLGIMNSITMHDMLNQLTVLNGYIDLSKMNEKDPKLSANLIKMSQVTNNIKEQMEFTKDYPEIGVKKPSWISISRHTANAIAMLRPKGIVFKDETNGVEIFSDHLAEKVPYNLIDNSIRHGKHVKHIRIGAEQVGEALLLVYQDDGAGISLEDKKHLFKKGFGKNTELGLFLIREILSITNITIGEKGQPGQGVRFEMMVPASAWRRPLQQDKAEGSNS